MYTNNVGQAPSGMQDETARLQNDAGGEQQPGQHPYGSDPANAAPAAPQCGAAVGGA